MTLSRSLKMGSTVSISLYFSVTMLYLMLTLTFSGFSLVIMRRFSCINFSSFLIINNKSFLRDWIVLSAGMT